MEVFFTPLRNVANCRLGRLCLVALPLLVSGCQWMPGAYDPPPTQPRTVSEWMKQPRVGDDMHRKD